MELDILYNKIVAAFVAVFTCWPVKMAISAVITVISFLFGPIDTAFIALFVLVFVDLLTRWLAITREYMIESGCGRGIAYCFIMAWKTGKLNSQEMRQKFIPKIIAYILLLIASNLLIHILPPIVINGKNWAETPDDLINSYLALTEVMSILENLIAAGFDGLKPLEGYVVKKRTDLVGQTDNAAVQQAVTTIANKQGVVEK
jgi:phage-related holin